jgi:acyl dehydratase
MTQTVFARGDGGFGGPPGRSTGRRELPDRSPDRIHRWTTIPQQALIYRLSGDYNPLHADPNIAWKAGFKRPILHGLATFGISALAIIDVLCGGDPTKLRAISGRFSAPVYPGNTLRTDIWLEADSILFQTVIEGSKGIAVSNGIASITPN